MTSPTIGASEPWTAVTGDRSVVRDDLTSARYRLLVAPSVLGALGGERAVRAALTGMIGTYRCVECGNEGRLDRGFAASLLVVVDEEIDGVQDPGGAGGVHVPRLAHPGCSDSKLKVVPATRGHAACPALPGVAWLRPADAEPAAVVVLPVTAEAAASVWHDGPERILSPELVAHGFTPLSDLDAAFSRSESLSGWYAEGELAVRDRHGRPVWRGALAGPHAWIFAALRARAVGLVIAAVGPEETSQGRWLAGAVADGLAVGVAMRLADPNGATGRDAAHGSTTPIRPLRLPTQRRRDSGAIATSVAAA